MVTVTVEIEAYEGAEESIRELLSFLQFTNKINRFTYVDQTGNAAPAQRGAGMKEMIDNFDRWKVNQQLIRIQASAGRGKTLDIACKIVNYDPGEQMLTVYDVDRKQVEQLRWNEIDEVYPALQN